jgi:hypothetical protein
MLKVTFEIVHPLDHPEYYCAHHGEHPATDPATIPDEHWRSVESTKDSPGLLIDQYAGLLEQIRDGELIRNVRIWHAQDPAWTEINIGDADRIERLTRLARRSNDA